MIKGIHHVGIATQDLDKLVTFYCDIFGLEKAFEFGWTEDGDMRDAAAALTGIPRSTARAVMLKSAKAWLEIFHFETPGSDRSDDHGLNQTGLNHLCFESDDVGRDYEAISARGGNFLSPPQEMGPMRIAYLRDPDGNMVEILQFLQDSG